MAFFDRSLAPKILGALFVAGGLVSIIIGVVFEDAEPDTALFWKGGIYTLLYAGAALLAVGIIVSVLKSDSKNSGEADPRKEDSHDGEED